MLMAADPNAALERAVADPPDPIVLDVEMPGMSGLELLRELRQEPTTRDTPVIIVTVHRDAPSIRDCFECGCSDYLTKPIGAGQLLRTVRHHLRA